MVNKEKTEDIVLRRNKNITEALDEEKLKWWVIPGGSVYLCFCTEHENNYGRSTFCCDKCVVIRTNQETLVNLYNVLHDALVVRELERP